MKILYLANVRLPTTNAHGLQISKMCEALASVGAEVTLLIPRRFNSIQDDIFTYYDLLRNFRVIILPTPDLNVFGRVGFWSQNVIFSLFSLFYYLIHSDFDLVYSRDELPIFFLSFFTKKIVWEIHVNKFNFLVKNLTRRALAIVAISGGLKRFLSGNGVNPDKISISPDAVDLSLFNNLPSDRAILRKNLNLPTDKLFVTYVGRYTTMNKDKGVNSLIQAFALVYQKIPTSRLLLVGIIEAELMNLKDFITQTGLPLESCIIILHQPHKEAMKYVKASDVLVMNYPNFGHYTLYMSPLKLFEYMASGNVIVSTGLPSIKEILSAKEAYLVEPDNINALADGIYQALTQPTESTAKAKSASILVRQYTWEARASNILQFLLYRQKQL